MLYVGLLTARYVYNTLNVNPFTIVCSCIMHFMYKQAHIHNEIRSVCCKQTYKEHIKYCKQVHI